jgi:hypothetical protein
MSRPPLLRAADFQAAWYYSMLVAAMLGVAVWATVGVTRSLPAMWRAGERGLAVLVASVTTVTAILYTCMQVTAAIGLLQGSVQL